MILPPSPCRYFFTQCRNSATATPTSVRGAFSSPGGPLQSPPWLLFYPASHVRPICSHYFNHYLQKRHSSDLPSLKLHVLITNRLFHLSHVHTQPLQACHTSSALLTFNFFQWNLLSLSHLRGTPKPLLTSSLPLFSKAKPVTKPKRDSFFLGCFLHLFPHPLCRAGSLQ